MNGLFLHLAIHTYQATCSALVKLALSQIFTNYQILPTNLSHLLILKLAQRLIRLRFLVMVILHVLLVHHASPPGAANSRFDLVHYGMHASESPLREGRTVPGLEPARHRFTWRFVSGHFTPHLRARRSRIATPCGTRVRTTCSGPPTTTSPPCPTATLGLVERLGISP